MRNSFAAAGRFTLLSDHFLKEIEKHNLVVYLSAPTGSIKEAEYIAFAAEALLKAGGIGVKVETAGKAFEKEVWLNLTNNFQEHYTYEMFVIDALMLDELTSFSCGMQNLGLRDTIVSDISFPDAAELIRIFGYYQVVDKPVIRVNQTFTPTRDSPTYKITEEESPPYKGEELLDNPFGVWRLTRK